MNFKEGEELELRDYFAGQALAGELAQQSGGYVTWENPVRLAERCYKLADAMLAVRNRAPEKAEAR